MTFWMKLARLLGRHYWVGATCRGCGCTWSLNPSCDWGMSDEQWAEIQERRRALAARRSRRGTSEYLVGIIGAMVLLATPVPAQQPDPKPLKVPNSSWHYDWSYLRDARFWTGVGASFAVTEYDIGSSHGRERTWFLRGADGQLSAAKYRLVTAGTNVVLLPLDGLAHGRWRWVPFGIRATLAVWRFNGARKNR